MAAERVTVHELRRRWKPHKQRLQSQRPDHPTLIRFHRACSWLARVETLPPDDVDFALLAQWIALNSLYGQWDQGQQFPVRDQECCRIFFDRLWDLDAQGRLSEVLIQHRPLVMRLLEDPHLDKLFWRDPGSERACQAKKLKFKAQSWYAESQWKPLLDHVVERIYLMRCQLIHGAATYGGKLNRRSLVHSSQMMTNLLTATLLILIERGADEDWGIMCYPPRATSLLPK